MDAVGVVTGLRAEARCLRGLEVRVACSGGRPERARALAQAMVEDGARGLVSYGLAGGLARELRPGDLLLPDTVTLPGGRRERVDGPWRERLAGSFSCYGLSSAAGVLAGSDHLVVDPGAKRDLARATGALAVDMESHVVAVVGRAAGVPFVVIRAIADPADQVLPQATRTALDPNGKVRIVALLADLLRRPTQLPALVSLGASSAKAFSVLRRAATAGGRRLRF